MQATIATRISLPSTSETAHSSWLLLTSRRPVMNDQGQLDHHADEQR